MVLPVHTASSFERHLNNLDDPLHGIAEQEATLRSLNRCAKVCFRTRA